MLNSTHLNRRELLLMSSGAAALCLGRLADGILPSAAVAGTAELRDASERLQSIPTTIGAWTSEPGTISDRELHAASIHGWVRRDYHHSDSGHRVGMTLLCGPAGPMAVHPPTSCFQGVGYTLLSGPVLTSIHRSDTDSEQSARADHVERDDFNKSTFRHKDSVMDQTVRVFWGWSTQGDWTAPARPRVAFRGIPWLYKLYVTDQSVLRRGIPVVPQAEAFLRESLPVLRQHLQGPAASARPSSDSPTA